MWKYSLPIVLVILLFTLYLMGPRPKKFSFDRSWPDMPETAEELTETAARNDNGLNLRADHESRIIWNDVQNRVKTETAMLYLHGFSASWYEGEPLHRDLCRSLGMNLYIPRLAAHGIETPDPLVDLQPASLFRSALTALSLTSKLGDRVVIAGTSTGATLALLLAAEFPDKVSALLLFSPNIQLADSHAWILTKPWGLQIACLFTGSRYHDTGEQDPVAVQYWYRRYRLEGVAALQNLLVKTMNKETFAKVNCPVFVGYYPGDTIVSVPAILKMTEFLGTPNHLKTVIPFPDAGVHVIANRHLSRTYDSVYTASLDFLNSMLSNSAPDPFNRR